MTFLFLILIKTRTKLPFFVEVSFIRVLITVRYAFPSNKNRVSLLFYFSNFVLFKQGSQTVDYFFIILYKFATLFPLYEMKLPSFSYFLYFRREYTWRINFYLYKRQFYSFFYCLLYSFYTCQLHMVKVGNYSGNCASVLCSF